ncbi:hypothetical protein BC936DRAFT_149847 [Jimgerdemannia flammicorona]|uniref:Uncharacterized protein n=1 Tax=Jimgerdemannia flammicorona TaxID=994334 RepID=A0A433D004_9FUNG|nr:hypothetical protein BC936DRAFT_149847 [Jimgerdemannia flammicorona]
MVVGVGIQNRAHALSGTARHGRLFHHNLGALCDLGDLAGRGLDVAGARGSEKKAAYEQRFFPIILTYSSRIPSSFLSFFRPYSIPRQIKSKQDSNCGYLRQISSHTSTHATLLCRSVDGHEDKIGFQDCTLDVGAEEQVFAASAEHDFIEARFVNGQVVGVPGVNASLAQVDDGDLDVGTLVGDDGARGAT